MEGQSARVLALKRAAAGARAALEAAEGALAAAEAERDALAERVRFAVEQTVGRPAEVAAGPGGALSSPVGSPSNPPAEGGEPGVLALEAVDGGAPAKEPPPPLEQGGGGGGLAGQPGGEGAGGAGQATTYHESEIRGFTEWGEGGGRGRSRAASAAI